MVTGEATQIRPPAAINLAPETEHPPCHRRRLNHRSKARKTAGSCATPNRIPKITARGHLRGFTGDDGATSAETGRNPGEVYSKRMQRSHCLSITARNTNTPTKWASKSPPETRTGRDSSTSQSRFQHHCKIRDGDTTLRSLLQRNQHHQRRRRRRSSKRAQPSNLAWAEQLQSYLELT